MSTGRSFSRPLALLVAGAMFMELLDGTAINAAAPLVAQDLGTHATAIAAPISAYLVTVAAFIPASGWFVERYGGRRTFVLAVAVFTGASVLCAASPTVPLLTAARVVQGLGGALMVPVGRLVVLRQAQREDMLRAVAFLTWPALAAPLLGPVVGGVFATYLSWRWIFLINLPLGAAAALLAGLVPASCDAQWRSLDVRGLAVTVLALGCATAAATIIAAPGSDPWPATGLLVMTAGSVVIGVRHLQRTAEPLLSFAALRHVTFRVSHFGGSGFRIVVNSVPFLLPLLFIDHFGWSPVRAGLLLAALFLGNLAIKPATSPLLRRFGFRTTLFTAVLGSALTIVAFAALRSTTPMSAMVALLFASGAFRSLGFTAYNTIAFADVEQAELTEANTLSSTAQQLALGFGAATGALALHAGSLLTSTSGYQFAFVAAAALLVLPAAGILRLTPGAGSGLLATSP